MSDYMFMLENHLSANQNRAVSVVQAAAAQANVNLFLTGGAVRDMLGGFPIRDLNFAVEGNALKLVKTIEAQAGVKVTGIDEYRKSVRLLFDGAVSAEIAMARQERYPKNGARPVVTPATIQEDLRCRDFTINAIALSLNQASLGLLLDPNNGTADLENKELRAVYGRALYDDPGRLLRLIRFRVRFGFIIEPRTQQQYENARLEEMEKRITGRRLFEEFIEIAGEANPGEVLQALEEEELLSLFSPALTGPKLNMAGFSRLLKARQLIPSGVDLPINGLALFLYLLTEKLTPKEKASLAATTAMSKADSDLAPKLAARAKHARKGGEVGQAEEAIPGLRRPVESGGRGTDIPVSDLGTPVGPGQNQELHPEVFAGGAGDHRSPGGGDGPCTRNSEVQKAEGGADTGAGGCPRQEDSPTPRNRTSSPAGARQAAG